MNEETYVATQAQIVLIAKLIAGLPLVEFLYVAQRAQVIGPMVDPTLYRQASGKLDDVIRLANTLRKVQMEIERQAQVKP